MLIPVGDNVLRRNFPIMPIVLIVINVLVFAVQIRVFNSAEGREAQRIAEEFFKTWGLVPAKLMDGQLIGLLTHMFMHGGFMHIVGNMFFLWAFSCSLEEVVGRWTLFGFYLLFGVAGGLCHVFADTTSEIPLVGASGAIAGFMGAYTVMFGVTSKIKVYWIIWVAPIKLEIPAVAFGLFWFGLQVMWSEIDVLLESGVAWYAHIGGFLAGAGIMALCRGDTEAEVVRDRFGNVSLQSNEPAAEIETPTESRDPYILPENCPHCGHPVTQENQIDSLLRCPNPDCERMTFLEETGELASVP